MANEYKELATDLSHAITMVRENEVINTLFEANVELSVDYNKLFC